MFLIIGEEKTRPLVEYIPYYVTICQYVTSCICVCDLTIVSI